MNNTAVQVHIDTQMLTLDAVDHIIEATRVFGCDEEGLQTLKLNWPHYRFFTVDDDDMGEIEPYWQCETFSLYLVAASLGCASLTNDISNAVGVVIATIGIDEIY